MTLMWPQKGTGELLAEVKPIMVIHGIHVLLTAHTNISCKHIRKTSLPFTKHNTVIVDEDKFRPITDLVSVHSRVLSGPKILMGKQEEGLDLWALNIA